MYLTKYGKHVSPGGGGVPRGGRGDKGGVCARGGREGGGQLLPTYVPAPTAPPPTHARADPPAGARRAYARVGRDAGPRAAKPSHHRPLQHRGGGCLRRRQGPHGGAAPARHPHGCARACVWVGGGGACVHARACASALYPPTHSCHPPRPRPSPPVPTPPHPHPHRHPLPRREARPSRARPLLRYWSPAQQRVPWGAGAAGPGGVRARAGGLPHLGPGGVCGGRPPRHRVAPGGHRRGQRLHGGAGGGALPHPRGPGAGGQAGEGRGRGEWGGRAGWQGRVFGGGVGGRAVCALAGGMRLGVRTCGRERVARP